MANRVLINPQILSDIAEAIRNRYGITNTIKPVDMAELIYGISGNDMKKWYSWYMSNIAPIDGLYNSHSYSNVYVVGNELIVLYRSAPHHFSDASLCKMRISRTNLTTFESTSEDLLDGLNYFGSVYCDGKYYIFDKSMNRYDTADFKTFNAATYTVPSGASEPYYITVGDDNRFISTHSNSSKKGCMMYSDNYGLTWVQATGDDVYNATLTTHGATTKVGNVLVAYCQASKTDTPTNNDTVLNVLTSSDNGLTWNGTVVSDEDLKYCGPSFASGMFAQIGDEWFLCLSSRLQTTDGDGYIHLGNVRLFKGTADDVINGTMSIHSVIDDFNTECTSSGIATSVTMTDTGNIGMTTDGENLYIVYSKPLFPQSSPQKNLWLTSNCMLCLAVVNSVKVDISKEDSYYNSEWETERDSFVSAQDTEHDLYIYGDGDTINTNVYGIDVYEQSNYSRLPSGYFTPAVDMEIPFDEYIDIRIIGKIHNRYVNGAYANHYYGLNVDGKKYAITGSVNSYYFNKTNITNGACSLAFYRQDLIDYHLTYNNGVVSVALNGIEIDDVESYVVPMVEFNDTEKTAYLTFESLGTLVSAGSDIGGQGFMAITIDTDGDISSILGEIVVDPELTTYSITNNLTNCTTSQSATEINEGSAYNATITADDGYILSEITCTMGGVEQTVTDGVISIESVTGDIVITATATKEVTVENPITDGLVHWLKTDGVSDTTWTDSIDSTLSYTVTGYNADLNLVQANSRIALGTNEAIGVDTDFTIEYVLYSSSTGQLMLHSLSAGQWTYDISIRQNAYTIISSDYNYNSFSSTNSANFKEKLIHFAITKNSAGDYKIYINGKLEGSATDTTSLDSTYVWTIARESSYAGDVRVYNKALTADEVANNYKYEQNTYAFDVVN